MAQRRGHHKGQMDFRIGMKKRGLHHGDNPSKHRKLAPGRGRRSRARY